MSGPPNIPELAHGLSEEDWDSYKWLHDRYERRIFHEDQLLNSRMSLFLGIFVVILAGMAAIIVANLVIGEKALGVLILLALLGVLSALWTKILGTGKTLELTKKTTMALEKVVAQKYNKIELGSGHAPVNPFQPLMMRAEYPRAGVTKWMLAIPYWTGILSGVAFVILLGWSIWTHLGVWP